MKRLAGIEVGTVIARDDPDGLGRVRVRVPGIVGGESPNWAEPYGGTGGGSAQRGTFDPPAVGANVGVFFRRGDPDFPCYICGPHGAPGGTTDVPTDGEVEGDDRQNAVLEDEEWLIQRDSRSAAVPQRWRVQHKSTGAEIVIDSAGKIYLGDEAASEGVVLGTTYRSDETNLLLQLAQRFLTAGLNLNLVAADPAFLLAFPAAAALMANAGAALVSAQADVLGSSLATAINHVSLITFTE